MEIRYMTPDDSLLEISNIYEQSWKHAYHNIIPQSFFDSIPTGCWAGGISREGMQNLVMLKDDRMIGTASICKSRCAQYPEYGEIVSIYLLPGFIGQGYGKHLLQACTAELHKQGFDRILLWVLAKNTGARRFYEKNGLICSGESRCDNIGGKELTEIMYTFIFPEH